MSSELVAHLRNAYSNEWKAAARLEALEAENARLRGALTSIENKSRDLAEDSYTSNRGLWFACADEARRAREGGENG